MIVIVETAIVMVADLETGMSARGEEVGLVMAPLAEEAVAAARETAVDPPCEETETVDHHDEVVAVAALSIAGAETTDEMRTREVLMLSSRLRVPRVMRL